MPRNKNRNSQAKGPRPQRNYQKLVPRFKRRQVRVDEWTAEVVKVERCSSKEESYNAGSGWEGVFEYDTADKNRRCYLRGKGNVLGLDLTLEIFAVHCDRSPAVLHLFTIVKASMSPCGSSCIRSSSIPILSRGSRAFGISTARAVSFWTESEVLVSELGLEILSGSLEEAESRL